MYPLYFKQSTAKTEYIKSGTNDPPRISYGDNDNHDDDGVALGLVNDLLRSKSNVSCSHIAALLPPVSTILTIQILESRILEVSRILVCPRSIE